MPRIAIVGAGIAGLTAALTLRDAGIACQVYEAAERVGGRMHSDAQTWADGMVSEWCGEFIDGDHDTIHRLIRRFGLATADLNGGLAGQAPSLMYLLGRFYPPADLSRDLAAIAPVLARQAREAGYPTTYARHTPAGVALDQLSVHDWIEQHVPGGHGVPLGRFLDGGCTGIYGLDTSEQSALNLIYMFGSMFGADDAEQAAPTPLQGTCKIVGGNEQLPRAIARELPEEMLHLGRRLVALERERDDALTLTFVGAGDVARVACDRVILALPFSTLRRVDCQRAGFDALKQTAIEQLGYGTISKLFLQFDQPYWYGDGSWPSARGGFYITDLDVRTLWDASRGQTGAHGMLVAYAGGKQGAAYAPPAAYTSTGSAGLASAEKDPTDGSTAIIQGYAQACLRQVEQLFPGISAHYTGRAALSYPTGDPNLLGSYACWRVGQYTRFAGYEGVAQGPVHFAGEHCSLEFQGYMEGAAREGVRAAREIIGSAG